MWFGLLTAGAHPSRPAATQHLATLFVWGPQTRARIDGPQAHVAAGMRSLRRTAGDDIGTFCRPRCFNCRRPYPLPDPIEIRREQDVLDLADVVQDDHDQAEATADAEHNRGTAETATSPTGAVFALVHVEDRAREGAEGEALVLLPSRHLAMLVPFDALGIFAGLLGEAFGDAELPECDVCGEPVPGGRLGEPNRAARRKPARGRGRPEDEGRRRAA